MSAIGENASIRDNPGLSLRKVWRTLSAYWPKSGTERRGALSPGKAWLTGELNRRDFLGLLEASMALAGITACTMQKPESIIEAARSKNDLHLDDITYYATALLKQGYGIGILGTSHLGRPTKIEGNPNHPASLGAASAEMQASILELYDPDRAKVLRKGKEVESWQNLAAFLQSADSHNKTLHLVTGPTTSLAFRDQVSRLMVKNPRLKWYVSLAWDQERRDAALLKFFGSVPTVVHRFDRALCVASFDFDFLSRDPNSLRYAHDFADSRRVRDASGTMSRLYALEASPSLVGAMADHRLPIRNSLITEALCYLASDLGIVECPLPDKTHLHPEQIDFIKAMAQDLKQHGDRSLVTVGDHQPTEAQFIGYMINQQLGSMGQTLTFRQSPFHAQKDTIKPKPLIQLPEAIRAAGPHALLILNANPAYDSASELDWADLTRKVDWSVHLDLYENETSTHCQWFVPAAHSLESWGDACAPDGTPTFLQPLIRPLYNGKTNTEVLSLLLDVQPLTAEEALKAYWREKWGAKDFASKWTRSLALGCDPTGQPPLIDLLPMKVEIAAFQKGIAFPAPSAFEAQILPDPVLFDGSLSNNAWLQELPKPISKITWDNAVYISPSTAKALKLLHGDVIKIKHEDSFLTAPVWIQPGQARDTFTLFLGYGRTKAGRIGTQVGYSVRPLRTQQNWYEISSISIEKTGDNHAFACTQNPVKPATQGDATFPVFEWADYKKDSGSVERELKPAGEPISLIPRNPKLNPIDYGPKEAWGMTIDLNTCIGCSACVLACQAENNIPTVGYEQVKLGREMQWIRIDQYFDGPDDNPNFMHQPVTCMHCENAPCEEVCPVGATVHNEEGINQMVYNRCVGTRYCSNNCPYKVRHFNFLDYNDMKDPGLKLMRNPEVTVRSLGVMEKCTYCIQRIDRTRIEKEKSGGKASARELQTACQQTCAVQAIVFGNLNDRNAEISRTACSPLRYDLLGELNTKPRTGYLARFFNRNLRGSPI